MVIIPARSHPFPPLRPQPSCLAKLAGFFAYDPVSGEATSGPESSSAAHTGLFRLGEFVKPSAVVVSACLPAAKAGCVCTL